MKKLTITELRAIIKNVISEAKAKKTDDGSIAYTPSYGWGVKEYDQPSIKNHNLHYNQPVFKKFMKDMLGVNEQNDEDKDKK